MAEAQDLTAYRGEERRTPLSIGGLSPIARQPAGRYRSEEKFDWEQVAATLRKNRRIAFIFALGVMLSAVLVSLQMKDVYEPVARVEIDPSGIGLLNSHERESGDQSGAEYLETQTQILKSDALAMKVIRKLHLDQKRAIVGEAAVLYQSAAAQPARISPQGDEQPAMQTTAAANTYGPADSKTVEDAPASMIEQVRAESFGEDTKIVIKGNGRLADEVKRSTLPGRLVLDFQGVRLHVDRQSSARAHDSSLPGLGSIRFGQYRPDAARVVIDLKEPVEYEVAPLDNKMVVTLRVPDRAVNSLAAQAASAGSPDERPEVSANAEGSVAGSGGTSDSGQSKASLVTANLSEPPVDGSTSTTPVDPNLERASSDGERTPNENAALRYFRQNLKVSTSRNSRIVEVTFASSDAHLATQATNALVNAFIDSDYRTRYETTMRTSDWLTGQLAGLRQKVRDSNQALAEYQKQSGLVDPEEKYNPLLEKAGELNRQYSQAEADRIQLEAYARVAEAGSVESLPQIRDSVLIQGLTQKLVESRAQLARALAIYGENNSNVKRLRSETDELKAQLENEKRAIAGGLKASYRASVTRERLMAQAVEKMKTTIGSMGEKMVQYRLLKNEAQASTELFNTLLARVKEAGVYAGMRSNNIRIVDAAVVPDRPAGPHRLLDIAIGLLAALVGGAALAFIKEAMNNRVRTSNDVARWTGLPSLAMIPEIPLANGHGPKLGLHRSGSHFLGNGNGARAIARLPRLMSAEALTPEADAINNLRTSVLLSRGAGGRRVILVVATSSKAGSTTIAANLAIALARRGKTCLVDGDLRRPMVSRAFALAPVAGLSDVLRGDATVEQALSVAPRAGGLSLLMGGRIPSNPVDLLTGDTMRDLMRVLRERFEFVVIDSPPAIPFPDCRILSPLSDGVVLVSRSGMTTRRTLLRCAELIGEARAPLLGVVVNGVDLDSTDYCYYTCTSGKDAYPENGHQYWPAIAMASGNGFKAKPNVL